jgi:hypothetical protein
MAYSFGVTSTVGSVAGLLQNVSITGTAQVAEAIGATGDIEANTAYGVSGEFSAELVYESGAPAAGADITVGSSTYIVTSVAEIESNTEYKKCSISGRLKTT